MEIMEEICGREQEELVKRIQELYSVIRLLPWKESLDEKEKWAAGMYRDSFFQAVPKGLCHFIGHCRRSFVSGLAMALYKHLLKTSRRGT